MNEVVKANIDYPLDSDWFKIKSLGAFKNGILTITVKEAIQVFHLKYLQFHEWWKTWVTIPRLSLSGFDNGFGRTNSITKVYDLEGATN